MHDDQLKPIITAVHEDNYGVYGARKVQRALRREKEIVIGRDQGLVAVRALAERAHHDQRAAGCTIVAPVPARPA